jgi:chromosome segregation protein
MYLSKLELQGFKSFANKTKLKFSDGISCVIGPNGSGKSNIVDAIRWVLGEQKVSTLRTDRMESVIFNGAKDSRPLSMAEVSLTVHNNKNVLASEYTDVMISRRLYRSGESQYLLNQSPCRLKDIHDLFMDTGMGANSYSVIELSMVESIISENPSDRRHLFEEAAGVTKYKTRRRSALRKLESTRQDMSRIEDIISEISRNVNSLSRQVGKARRYLEFQEKLKKLEIDLARYHYAQYCDEVEPLRKTLAEISLIKEDASQQITLEEAILEEYKRELIQYEQQIGEFSRQLHARDEKLHQIKEDKAIAQTRSRSLMDNILRNTNDIDEINDKVKVLTGKMEEKNKILETASADFEVLDSEYIQNEKEFQILVNNLKEEKISLDSLNQAYKEHLNKVHAEREISQQKKYQLSWNKEQIESFSTENESLTEANNQLEKKLDELNNTRRKTEEDKEKFEQRVKFLEQKKHGCHQKIISLGDDVKKYTHQTESLQTQLTFYKDIISNYQGHLESTRTLMLNRNDFPGLHGPISDVINVEENYALAVEIALGDAVNYLIVDKVDTAQSILGHVDNKKLGRATIIPLERIKNIKSGSDKYSMENSLADHVSCDPEYETIIHLLIGDVMVVETLQDAIHASEKNQGIKYVTVNGEIITEYQAISGGQKKDPGSSLIGRKEQIEKIINQINILKKNIEKNEQNKARLLLEEEAIDKEVYTVKKDLDLISENLRDFYRNETEIRVQKLNYAENIKKSENIKEETVSLLSQLEKDITKSENTLKGMDGHLKSLETDISKLTEKYAGEELTVQEKGEIVKNLNYQLIKAANDRSNIETEITRIKTDISDLNQLHKRRTDEITNMETEQTQINSDLENWEKIQAQTLEEHDTIEKEKTKFEQDYHEVKDKILNLENQIKKYRKQHDSSLERTQQLELKIQENEMKSLAIKDRIIEDYHDDISIGIPYDGLNIEESEQQIEALKYKINQMGQVNPLAVSDYERESERLEFYNKQFNDLKDAEKSLLETINKINITANSLFTETFNSIKENFEKVFTTFFINGEGTLRMEENSDPLEANIEILVRPKGKRMQTISLLSGGEKTLTAISLLFSIYLVKPSPFCILDEIDAPLDDVNIGRFTKALHDFSSDTQFIVVTHNKRTMESADTLYGVTMEEEGLSKLVSVKFN